MITLGPALFDNNNRLMTLSGGYKNLHYLTVLPDFWLHLHRTLSHQAWVLLMEYTEG
jgi:hypothetical protein